MGKTLCGERLGDGEEKRVIVGAYQMSGHAGGEYGAGAKVISRTIVLPIVLQFIR